MISYRTIMTILAVSVCISAYISVATLTDLAWAQVYLLLMLIYLLGAGYAVYRAANRTGDVGSRTLAAVSILCLVIYTLMQDSVYIGAIAGVVIGITGMVRIAGVQRSDHS